MTLLSHEEIHAALPDGWRHEGDELLLDRELADFNEAIAFVDGVAVLAERANHHPDILVHGYRNVRLTLSTHSEGGITASDTDLARVINALP